MTLALPSRRIALLPGRWASNELWRRARAVPSLDLRFAENKSLVDAITGANLVTFTRASSGTYVDSQGVIRTAVTNLLRRSEEFDQTWIAQNGYSVTANQAVAPNGTLTADAVSRTNASTQYLYQNITQSGTLTFSCWVRTASGTATFRLAAFNATDGFKESADLTASANWQRFSFTVTQSGATTSWYPCNCAINTTFYIWGAQLEQSTTVGEYVKTEATINSAPRFDHNPTTGESLGLLVEEQRTNLCLQSAAISTSPWVPNGTETCVASNLTDPAGGLNAFKINFGGSGAFERWQQAITVVNGTTYTLSAWVRSTSGTASFRLRFAGGVTSSDLTATTTWQRFAFTLTAGTTAGFFAFNAASTGVAAEIHVWGAQLEAGAFPTSYIPTTTSAVTRSADVASISGSNFSGWYRQDEGTVFYDGTVSQGLAAFPWFYNVSDGTANNSIGVYQFTNGIYGSVIANATPATPDLTVLLSPVSGAAVKHALAAKAFDTRAASNGTLSSAQANTVMPAVNQLAIGQRVTGNRMTGTIRRLTYWTQRLSNSTLQELTR